MPGPSPTRSKMWSAATRILGSHRYAQSAAACPHALPAAFQPSSGVLVPVAGASEGVVLMAVSFRSSAEGGVWIHADWRSEAMLGE